MNRDIIKILLIEDNPGDARLIKEMLSEISIAQFQIQSADLLSKGFEILGTGGIDAVLLDLSLPDSQGLDTFTRIYKYAPYVPIIVLTGLYDESLAANAVREGAQDYLVKGQVDSNLLTRSIRYSIERKKSEKALRESEKRFRELTDLLPQGVFEADTKGNLLFINRSGLESLGYTQEDIANGLNAIQMFAPQDRDKSIMNLRRILSGEKLKGTEYSALRKDGSIYPVIMYANLIIRDSETIGLRGIVVDITERKRVEEELLKIQKLDSISLLAGGIAHDFNNILTSILGNISLARMLRDPKVIENKLINAENACEIAKALTQQLLTFSKGGLPVKELSCIDKTLRDSALFASSGSKIKCEFSIPDDLWCAEIDKGQINQAISNLVINAEQAMPNGGLIKISANNVTLEYLKHNLPLKEGDYVKVSISDHGTGIPDEIMPKIFDPFFTTKPKGNGLGLPTCYSIVKKHGGYITVDPQNGTGTTFSFYLPASPNKVSATEIQDQNKPFSGRGRILIMDDDENIRQICFYMLSELGYDIMTSSEGIETIEIYEAAKDSNRPFDVIIMDLTIPGGMGGKETISKIREFDPNIKAIVSSGYSDDEVMSQFRQFGFNGAISKPYRMEEISKILENVMKSPTDVSNGIMQG